MYIKIKSQIVPKIHTLTLYKSLNKKQFKNLIDQMFSAEFKEMLKVLEKKTGERHYVKRSKNNVITNCLSSYGINKVSITKQRVYDNKENAYTLFGMYIILNPYNMLQPKSRIQLFQICEQNLTEMTEQFRTCLSIFGKEYEDIRCFELHRLDLCVNLYLNETRKDNYLSLLKRCLIPAKYEMEQIYDEISHRNKVSNHRIALKNRSVSVVAYDKAHQLKMSGMHDLDAEFAEGILRLEVQIGRNYIRLLQDELANCSEKTDVIVLLKQIENISPDLFYRYLNKVFLTGSYYPLQTAKDVIADSSYRKKTKKKMIRLMELASVKRSLEGGIQEYIMIYGVERNKINELLKKFKQIELNPVTIPVKWKYSVMPDIEDLISMAYERGGAV